VTPLTIACTVGEIADRLGAELDGPPGLVINGFDAIERAQQGSLTFIRSERYADAWKASAASAALVTRGVVIDGHDPSSRALLFVDDADLALARVMELIGPRSSPREAGVDRTACVDPDARVSKLATIGPNCTIEAGAIIADGAHLVANVYVGAGSKIGRHTTLMPSVVVMDGCEVGAQCTLHPCVVIGADGFGYTPSSDGSGLVKIPHPGGVVIEDGVEIGACTAIDRAKLGDTRIGAGTKIDNHVQIGHGCRIGRSCVICGQTGISGSVTIGDGVQIGGGVGIADNLEIGDGARIGAQAGVMNDVPAGETWVGYPAGLAREQMPNYAAFRNLGEIGREVKRLRKAVDRMQSEE